MKMTKSRAARGVRVLTTGTLAGVTGGKQGNDTVIRKRDSAYVSPDANPLYVGSEAEGTNPLYV